MSRKRDERETLAKVYEGLKALRADDADAKNALLGLLAPLAGLEDMK